uniref:Uncharacterized protein n=1 Tax=Anguilla anguilla TaxID=7936 RepID=A0A0E9RFS6_ANGAN
MFHIATQLQQTNVSYSLTHSFQPTTVTNNSFSQLPFQTTNSFSKLVFHTTNSFSQLPFQTITNFSKLVFCRTASANYRFKQQLQQTSVS